MVTEGAEAVTGQPTPSQKVISSVAEAKGIARLELDHPLFDAIDPDALNNLIASSESIELTFQYAGFVITVTANNEVYVSRKEG